MNNFKYLEPKFDGAKSFYKKAILDFDPALVSSIMDTINYKYKKLVRRYFYNKVNDLDDLEDIEYRSNYFNKSVYDFTINNLIFKVIVLPIDNLNLNNFIRLVMQELKYDAENEADSFID